MTQMVLPPLDDPSLHFWITQAVARGMGVRLSEAISRGMIGIEEFAGLVTGCRECQHVEACMARLGQPGAESTRPDFCGNKQVLTELAEQF